VAIPSYPVACGLTVLDNLNGTAALTVSGTGGAAWVVCRSAVQVQAGGAGAYAVAASGTGDGAATGAGGYGFWNWTLFVEGATAGLLKDVSRVVFRPLIDPADPVHKRILDAFVTGIRALNLSGVGSATNKVYARWFPTYLAGIDGADASPAAGGLPQVQVAPYPRETVGGLLTNRDDVIYPVLVAFFAGAEPTLDNDLARNLKWRRQVAARFRNQQMAGVPEVVVVEWQPDSVVSTDWLKDNYLAGAMLFNVRSRETRGLVA